MVAVTGQSPSPVAPPSLSVLEAVLERITYASEDTGYTVARVATGRTGPDLLTVAGPLLGAQAGESLRLTGHWQELIARALAVPIPYRPVPGDPIYHLRLGDRCFVIADHDLSGPLRDLVTAVLALGEAM